MATNPIVNETDVARNLLGDSNKEDAASSLESLGLTFNDPETETKPAKKRGRKPKNSVVTEEPEVLPPSRGHIMLGEEMVEAQALLVSVLAGFITEPESVKKIYELHVKVHKEKLTLAYATLAKEYGIEVSGKMAALGMLAMAQVGLGRDVWNAWVPKQETENSKG